MSLLQVYRVNYSAYQQNHFFQDEKKVLSEISGVKYLTHLSEFNPQFPVALITNTHTNPESISQAILEKTSLLIHPNSGHDNFQADFIKNAHFPIVVGNPIRAHAVAEYILSALFQHFTKLPNHHHWDNDRLWDRKLVRDQKILLLGFGTIGKILQKSLSALCPNLHVVDPLIGSDIKLKNFHSALSDEIISGADIIICATSLNPTSYKMINEKFLKLVASDCLIVNASRGEVIDETALVQFLEKNENATCYLDVFEQEPFQPGHLSDLKHINKTSHIAGVYHNLNRDIIDFEYWVIKNFLEQTLDDFKKEHHSFILNS